MKIKKSEWFQKRWFEFRAGNNVYLGLSAAIASMLIVIHRFLIEKVPSLYGLLGDLSSFVIIFLIAYVPASIAMGHWHYKHQMKLELTYQFLQTPFILKAFRLVLEAKDGTVDKKEVESFRKLLEKLEKHALTKDLK